MELTEISRLDNVLELNRNTTMKMSQLLTKEINSINRQLYELEMRGRASFKLETKFCKALVYVQCLNLQNRTLKA